MVNKDICDTLLEQYGAEQPLKVRKNISISENGVHYLATVDPEREIAVFQIDGNIIKEGSKCDKLALAKDLTRDKSWIGYFIELKGGNIGHAITQLENAITHTIFKDSTLRKKFARIVSSAGIPSNNGSTEFERARNRFKSKYDCELKRLKSKQPDRI